MGKKRQDSFLVPDRYCGHSRQTFAARKPLKILGDLMLRGLLEGSLHLLKFGVIVVRHIAVDDNPHFEHRL
jgi:hypothetical protein